MHGIDRLIRLREENNGAGLAMLAHRPRFALLDSRHDDGTAPKAVTGFNLFQTPEVIAEQMAEILKERIQPGSRILEPSAGLGRLYKPLSGVKAEWLMVEEQAECIRALRDAIKGADIHPRDFLGVSVEDIGGPVGGVIMNPPFQRGTDIKHILHAAEMLEDGGRLVSLCYNGAKQNAQLKPICARWEVLPENSFKDEGTGASVALLVIDK